MKVVIAVADQDVLGCGRALTGLAYVALVEPAGARHLLPCTIRGQQIRLFDSNHRIRSSLI